MKNILVTILIIMIYSISFASGEPDGFFGLKFGEPVPEEFIVAEGSLEFEKAVDNFGGCGTHHEDEWESAFESICDREHAKNELLFDYREMLIYTDKIPEEFDEAWAEIVGDYRPLVPVSPPEPNSMFDSYIALISHKTRVLFGIWAYGKMTPCDVNVPVIEKYLLEKYPDLELSWLTTNLREMENRAEKRWLESKKKNKDQIIIAESDQDLIWDNGEFKKNNVHWEEAWIRSDNFKIYLSCNYFDVKHLKLEIDSEAQFEDLFKEVGRLYLKKLNIDTSGF